MKHNGAQQRNMIHKEDSILTKTGVTTFLKHVKMDDLMTMH